jgi:hypothetical protein
MKTIRVFLMIAVVALGCVTAGCEADWPGCGDRDGNGNPYPCLPQ